MAGRPCWPSRRRRSRPRPPGRRRASSHCRRRHLALARQCSRRRPSGWESPWTRLWAWGRACPVARRPVTPRIR
ncbi:hypothetical protein ACFPRL_16740 [Pseudoclavibacter helvolus]